MGYGTTPYGTSAYGSPMTKQLTPESGLRHDRVWIARETTANVADSDPSYMLYSDRLLESTWTPTGNNERMDGLGTSLPVDFGKGNEEHEYTLAYSLQRAVVDSNGDPDDPLGDAMTRNSAEQVPNTHTVITRDNNPTAGPQDETDTEGFVQYMVGLGGKAAYEMESDPEEGEPVPVELTYMFQKARSYVFLRPDSDTLVCLKSSDSGDTSQTATIYSDADPTTNEEVDLDGSNLVSSTATYTDPIISLDGEATGNVTLHINDGDDTTPSEGTQLAILHGTKEYHQGGGELEGDLGVPLPTSATPSALGTSYEWFQGSTVHHDGSAVEGATINNMVVAGENGFDQPSDHTSVAGSVHEGNRVATIETDYVGQKTSHEFIDEMLRGLTKDHSWELSNTKITWTDCSVTGEVERPRESDEAFAETGVTLEAGGITVTNTA